MRICDILAANRVVVDKGGSRVQNKEQAVHLLSELISPALKVDSATIEHMLLERERLQSTGIGDGVAIPHTSIDRAGGRAAALLLCPRGLPFDSIDGKEVRIVFGVVGPKEATSEHLRVLARVSRLLRDADTRDALVHAGSNEDAFALVEARDRQMG